MDNSKHWNERIGYIFWMDAEFNYLDSLKTAKKMVDIADDSITKKEFKVLLSQAEEKQFNKKELRELKRYIVDSFPKLYNKSKIGTNQYIEWSNNQVRKVKYKEGVISNEEIILKVGLELKRIFEPHDKGSRYYQVKIENDEVIKTKDELIDYIKSERVYGIISKIRLEQYISVILFQEQLNKSLEIEKLYPAIGVFADKNENLVVCYPGVEDITLQGTNTFQDRIIKLCEKRGIDVKGDLISDYLKVINFGTIPVNVMLTTLGYVITASFFHVLKDVLDLFPNLFWTAEPAGVGKTNHLEVFCNFLFGTELKSNDDVDSPARITLNSTAHTPPLLMDDIDKLKDEGMSFIKGNSTRKKGRERLTKEQVLKSDDTYTGFVGSGNSSHFLSGNKNDAFRSRCLILDEFNKIDGDCKEATEFMNLYSKLKTDKIFGYFLLLKSIEFIDSMIEGNFSTKMKIEQYFKEKRSKIAKFFKEKAIQTENSRRITIYTLLVMGWEFWEFTFNSKGLKCELLSEALDIYNNNIFIDLVLKCEEKGSSISVAEFENIIEFYEANNSNIESLKYPYEDTHKNVILTTTFINDYDKWARERGYSQLNGLPTLRELIVKLIQQPIEVKAYKVRNRKGLYQVDGPCQLSKRGVIFPLKEIKRKLGLDLAFEKAQKLERELKNLFTQDNKTVELNSAIDVLEINGDFERDYIKKRIEKLILNRFLSQNNGKITLL